MKLAVPLAALTAMLATPAMAYCVSVPDGPATYNVENSAELAICHQNELITDTERRADQARFDATLQDFQLDQVRQQQRLMTAPDPF
jgi:hypothetical protein